MGEVHTGSIVIKRGNWYIFKWSGKRDIGIYHKCRSDFKTCHSVRYMRKGGVWGAGPRCKEGWRCSACLKPALPSIVGLFTLGFWDTATREIDHEVYNS